ncbi:MAG TPA: hypothetical protein VN721_15375 [Flavipsychrobacter sp.]|nr:hypothetical protein [Flavipsychrobacter sp.]
MKKLLILLCIAPSLCCAQNFEVGINGGINFHSLPVKNIYTHQDKAKIGYAISFKAALMLPQYQIGIGGEMVSLSEYNYLMPVYTSRVYNNLAKPLIAPYVFLNRMFDFSNGYFFAGIMAGPAIADVGVNTWEYPNGNNGIPSGYTTTYNSVIGYIGGLQGGAVFYLSDAIGLSVEGSLRYTNFNYNDPKSMTLDNPYHYKVYYFPITFGIRFRV